ncbi:hypothetical protein FRUB_09902 [Fimbriiglobus ruber]|uniref:Uncharacterized protein n=2 Tax=Fimbriiglobus ruber TaxID=1908690 RepID=A0A225D0B9_9BACT|nr:hypothetical protein FRUB_09902 [Fimbriiglobus ruber]
MSGRRIGGVVCIAFAALMLVAGSSAKSEGPALTDPSGLGVSAAVGRFIVPLLVFIVGLWLLQKPKVKE